MPRRVEVLVHPHYPGVVQLHQHLRLLAELQPRIAFLLERLELVLVDDFDCSLNSLLAWRRADLHAELHLAEVAAAEDVPQVPRLPHVLLRDPRLDLEKGENGEGFHVTLDVGVHAQGKPVAVEQPAHVAPLHQRVADEAAVVAQGLGEVAVRAVAIDQDVLAGDVLVPHHDVAGRVPAYDDLPLVLAQFVHLVGPSPNPLQHREDLLVRRHLGVQERLRL
mmetsp:Transcript_118056/g.320414  ORF Transcript_118056/g.320414 Transcript_118056/m.320414 type:complete len:221 (-) Transcript_118056:127-789(-)